MTGYIPAFETQRDENAPTPWTNCNPASAAMLVDLWTYGRINTSDVALRRASPIPLNVGMNFAAVSAAIAKLFPELGALRYSERDGSGNANLSWGQLLTHLRSGGGAVVCGVYGGNDAVGNSKGWGDWKTVDSGLLIRRWQPSGTFGHAVFVCDAGDTDVLLMDPLGHGDYAGDRIPIAALWSFIWKTGWADATVRVTAAHGFTSPRPQPQRFSDVPATHQFHDEIEWLAEQGITRGAGGGRFEPEAAVTRGQMAAFLYRLANRG